MAVVVLYLGFLCGILSLIRHDGERWVLANATAIPLLISGALGEILDYNHIPFNFWFSVSIDLIVIVTIARNLILNQDDLPRNDAIILALFPAAWVFYTLGGWLSLWGTTTVVTVQFLLCLPWNRIGARALRSLHAARADHDTNMKFLGEARAPTYELLK